MASIRTNVEESEPHWTQNKDFGSNLEFLAPSKLISLQRQSNGFGFTLRHFVVYPPELIKRSSETGVNGLDHLVESVERQKTEPMDTVFVRQVAPSGPADRAGLSTGDQIVSVNGHPVMGKSYSQVIELIVASQELLELGIIPKEDCVLQMVTPGLSVPPKISLSTHQLNQPPPPVKPKPMYRRRSSGESPGRVMSAVTINPAKSFHLNMPDKPSNSDTPSPAVTLRRGSVDRTAMENRSFVITSDSVDYNSNLKSRSSSSLESSSVSSPHMDGSYFMAATDSMGRPLALRFEKGSKVGNTLTVLEDSWTKSRSHSLPVAEPQGVEERSRTSSTLSDIGKVKTIKVTDVYGSTGGHSVVGIPSLMLSSSRAVASDSPSTTYMNTNSDVGSRQPIASDPGFQKSRPSHEETMATSYLRKTLASRMNKDRQGGLKSSTMGTTLLQSRDAYPQQQSSSNGHWVGLESNTESYKESDSPHPAKVPRQSDSHPKLGGYSGQVSVYPGKPSFDETTFSPGPVSSASESDATRPNKQSSPKPRRRSYLMATSRSTPAPSDQKIWATAPENKKPTKSPVFEALSTMLSPAMVHVSSGMELCADVGREEGMDIAPNEQDDEVFPDSDEGKVTSESVVQRTNRRISYVMATSSPASAKYETSLEETKEEEEIKEQGDAVRGMLEVCKEGLLWRKLAVVDGGKRSSARSWKPVFVVLRGHILYLHKDKGSAHQDDVSDEQPISIKSSIVDIAHDYTKRKNVFRLTTFNGSEFLFQTEDHDSMMSWIAAIQANNNPDEDENGVSSKSLIIRRMKTVEHEASGPITASPSHKLSPPMSMNSKISGIPGIINIKKSLSFKNITTGQKGESGKNLSNKALKKRKKPHHPNSYPSGHSIGVPIELCPPSKNNKMIPLIVEHCCDVVERKGLETVGVYRVPGNSAAVTALQEELNNRGIENVCLDEEKWSDVNNITSLLKLFLRKLPEGLVTADLYDVFIESNKKEDAGERMWSIRAVVQELPEHNYETLKFLVNHLKTVSDNCDKNKMEVRNLAIVFGPTVIRTGDDSMMAMVKDMSDQCRIVETLITECGWFFEDAEGEDCPVKSSPSSLDCPQDQILSQNVLSSLGQIAVNFGDDGTYKPKSSGISLHMPKFRSKSSKSDSGQGSSSDGPLSDSQGSEGSPPPERAPLIRSLSGEGSRSNSPTLERSSKFGVKRVTESSSSVHVVIDPCDGEFRSKGAGSLKAYSYSHPPPPSYRRVNLQKRPTSPGTPDQPFSPLEVSFTLGPHDLEVKKSPDESPSDIDSVPKPSFSSFSEETRRRLLKLNLQKKAAEKRRQSEGEREATSPLFERSDEITRDGARDVHRTLSDQENFENADHTSSSSTSRSSSAHSSKNPSLDSLSVAPQPEKLPGGPAYGEPLRVSGSFKTNDSHQDTRPRSNETVLAVVKGRGVVSGKVRQFEPAWRPSSLEIRRKRESTEDVRLARRSMGSEESSDTSSDEGDVNAISMSKTFDEKLRNLLDLENPFEKKRPGSDAQSDDEKSSVRSEPQRRPLLSGDEMSQRRASDEPVGRVYKIVGMMPCTDSYGTPTTDSTAGNVSRDSYRNEKPETELRSSNIVEINTSKYFTLTPSAEDHTSSSQPALSAKRVSEDETPESSVGALRQRFESGTRRGSGTPNRTSPQGNQGVLSQKGNHSRDKDTTASPVRKSIGSVRTTTPVSLKDFSGKTAQTSPSRQNVEKRSNVHRPPDSRTATSRNIHLESSPAKHSSTMSPRYSSDINDVGDNRNMRSRLNMSGSAGERANWPQPYMDRNYGAPRVMNRDYGTKSKLLSHKDSAKELLPSKTRIPPRDTVGSQTKHKLEKDAQHIAKLLEEMHSERHLHLSRQQSDISGQAQKAAAQRAAMRRRRRSLGDDNDADVTSPCSNSPQEGNKHASLQVPQASYRTRPSNREATITHGPPRGNPVRSGFHTIAR